MITDRQEIATLDQWYGAGKSIIARIVAKTKVTRTKNSIKMDLLLADDTKEESFIQAVIYGDIAAEVDNEYKIGDLILVKGYAIRRRNLIYNKTKHQYEIILNYKSDIKKINQEKYKIKNILMPEPIQDLVNVEQMKHKEIGTFIGVILETDEIKTVHNSTTPLRYVDTTITDLTSVVKVRFWKDVTHFNENVIGSIIIIYGAQVNEYNGFLSLNVWTFSNLYKTYSGTNIIMNKLLNWSNKNTNDQILSVAQKECKVISQKDVDWNNMALSKIIQIKKQIIQIKREGKILDTNTNVKFNGKLKYVVFDRTTDEWYTGIRESMKAVTCDEFGNWYTKDKTLKVSGDEIVNFFKFRAAVADIEDNEIDFEVVFFNKSGKQLLGMSADEAKDLKFGDEDSAKQYLSTLTEVEGKIYEFCCNISYDKERGYADIIVEHIRHILQTRI